MFYVFEFNSNLSWAELIRSYINIRSYLRKKNMFYINMKESQI